MTLPELAENYGARPFVWCEPGGAVALYWVAIDGMSSPFAIPGGIRGWLLEPDIDSPSYRAGAYRVLWGGSAVVDPILEVELGDVDGDGVQELIVLEERHAGRTVSIWRWHGWGFSLMWRSPPGSYRDLGVVQVDIGQPLLITVARLP